MLGAEINHYALALEVGYTLDDVIPWSRR